MIKPYLILLLPPLFWSGNYVVGRLVASDMGALTLSFWRWQLALLLLLPFVIRPIFRQWHIIKTHFWPLLLLSILSVTGFNSLVYIGLKETTATNATIINSFIPIIILLISSIGFQESISKRQILGITVSLCGILIILTRLDLSVLQQLEINKGDLWILAATAVWAAYSVLLKHLRPDKLDGITFLGITIVLGTLALLPIYLWDPYQESPLAFNQSNMLVLLYVAVFPSIIAYLSWNYGIQKIGAAIGGQFIHLMPIFGALLAITFLHEQIYAYHLLGGLCIAAGLWLSTRKSKKGGFL